MGIPWLRRAARTVVRAAALLAAGVALLASAPPSAASEADAEALILQSFERYRAALVRGDGIAAADLASRDSIAYYSEMRNLALDASAAEVRRLEMMDRNIVLHLRQLADPKRLARMTGREVLSFAVHAGLIDGDGVATLRLGDIDVAAGGASAVLFDRRGNQSMFRFRFAREAGAWRVDLLAMIEFGRAMLPRLVASSGMEENDFILQVIRRKSGRDVAPSIWQPLGRR